MLKPLDDDPETDDFDIELELAETAADKECPQAEFDPDVVAGYGEKCPTPRKYEFCRYCAWSKDDLDAFWLRERQTRILTEAKRRGLVN